MVRIQYIQFTLLFTKGGGDSTPNEGVCITIPHVESDQCDPNWIVALLLPWNTCPTLCIEPM